MVTGITCSFKAMQHTVATAGAAVTIAVDPHEHLFYERRIFGDFSSYRRITGDQSINPQPMFYSSMRNPTDFSVRSLSARRKLCIYLTLVPTRLILANRKVGSSLVSSESLYLYEFASLMFSKKENKLHFMRVYYLPN